MQTHANMTRFKRKSIFQSHFVVTFMAVCMVYGHRMASKLLQLFFSSKFFQVRSNKESCHEPHPSGCYHCPLSRKTRWFPQVHSLTIDYYCSGDGWHLSYKEHLKNGWFWEWLGWPRADCSASLSRQRAERCSRIREFPHEDCGGVGDPMGSANLL